MPNWTYNRISCNKEIADKFLDKKEDGYIFDFNKLLPMPTSLNLTSGTIEEYAVAGYYVSLNKSERRNVEEILRDGKDDYYKNYWNKYKETINDFLNDLTKLENAKDIFKISDNESKKKFDNIEQLGKQYVDNIKNHGYAQWYDWCSSNWGTKWNVGEDVKVEECPCDEYQISFETAWSVPYGIVKKISELCNDDEFYWDFVNEDYDGVHHLTKENGEIIHTVTNLYCDYYNEEYIVM